MAHGVEDHAGDRRPVAGQGVAAAGVVDEAGRILARVAIVGRIVEAAQRERRALAVALARVVEDDVQEDVDAFAVQRLHRGAQLRETSRRKPRVRRKEGHRIVAPAIGEAERRQMALVDPGDDRHEFDGVDAELAEMRKARRFGERGDGAAQLPGDGRIEHRERLDGDLVDQAARPESAAVCAQRRPGARSPRPSARDRPCPRRPRSGADPGNRDGRAPARRDRQAASTGRNAGRRRHRSAHGRAGRSGCRRRRRGGRGGGGRLRPARADGGRSRAGRHRRRARARCGRHVATRRQTRFRRQPEWHQAAVLLQMPRGSDLR